MSLLQTNVILALKDNLKFHRESQKIIADNIARSNTPNAQPYTLTQSPSPSFIRLLSTQAGNSISSSPSPSPYTKIVDNQSMSEEVPGESRISIDNESAKLAEANDQHNLSLKMYGLWKNGFKKLLNIS